MDNVEEVEVVVGPSSLFQQANTLAATVNVITKNVEGVEIVGSTGNALPYSVTLMAGKRWDYEKYASFSFTSEQRKGFDAWNPSFRPNVSGRKITGKEEWPNYFSVLKGQLGDWSAQAVAYRSTKPELILLSCDTYGIMRLNHGLLSV